MDNALTVEFLIRTAWHVTKADAFAMEEMEAGGLFFAVDVMGHAFHLLIFRKEIILYL